MAKRDPDVLAPLDERILDCVPHGAEISRRSIHVFLTAAPVFDDEIDPRLAKLVRRGVLASRRDGHETIYSRVPFEEREKETMAKEAGRDAMAESWTTFKLFHGGELRDDAARTLALKAHSHGYVDGRVDAPAAGEAGLDERGRVARFGDLVQHDPDRRPAVVSSAPEVAKCDCGHSAEAHGFVGEDVASECSECSCARFQPWPDEPAAAPSEATVHFAIALSVRLSDEDAAKLAGFVERLVAAEKRLRLFTKLYEDVTETCFVCGGSGEGGPDQACSACDEMGRVSRGAEARHAAERRLAEVEGQLNALGCRKEERGDGSS